MLQLYKKRDFGAYISDTFTLLKQEGKEFFTIYFKLCAPFILILLASIYFFSDIFMSSFQSNDFNALEFMIQENLGIFSLASIILAISTIIMTAITYSFPIIYLKAMDEKIPSLQKFTYIKNYIKTNFLRIIIFGLGTTFLILPLLTIITGISIVLIFLIIGIPLLIILGPAAYAWISLAFFGYIEKKSSFFDAYGNSFTIIRKDAVAILGSTLIMLIIIQVIGFIPSMLLQLVFISKDLFSTMSDVDTYNTFGVKLLIIITTLIYTVISVVLYNTFLLQQGLVYYSAKEVKDNITAHSAIESIGAKNDY